MSLVIRYAELDDLNGLTELMYEYIVGFYKKPRPDSEKLHQLIQTLLKKQEGVQFVALLDGKLVGFATLYFTYSTMKADRYTVMNDLFVIEQLRDTEVESQLFLKCHKYTKEHQFTHMSWITAADNTRAQRFFDQVGGIRGDWVNYSIL
ncbi:GNAT family N-acetyltransferase [Paenibacillus cremeus]|uniref:GNAT family N-acetyltransferase n=1 Tax=Paenibacillus cremeus TaxID=2163881 RepID=A0A559KG08_9BACL|nr:GNAT family N-acetyltransferase [Paenibacillus cremeus]TVY11070.1 GNAT family N-acetyltransferase [Paenibacillus cremeus]